MGTFLIAAVEGSKERVEGCPTSGAWGVSSVVVFYLRRLAMPCLRHDRHEGTPLYFAA